MASRQASINSVPFHDRAEVLRRLAPLVRASGGQLLLFGSRARSDARPTSDIGREAVALGSPPSGS